jgi:sporulation protein YlmC with PRC-barrel domain
LVNLKELFGKKVITQDAFAIGEVDGVEFDIQKAIVTHIRVDLSKEGANELKFKKPFLGSVIICIPLSLVQAYGHVINLNVPLANLKTLQECR